MLYGVPSIRKFERIGCCALGLTCVVKAPILVDFWTDNFKLLVEAQSGALHIKTTGEY